MIAATPMAILRQALAWLDQGEDVALVTLVGIQGASSRSVGAQMAITAAGAAIGSFSGGCIEGAIIAEAQAALAMGKGRQVRFGAGSPYIDVRLPCGGGIDLAFTPHPSRAVMAEAAARLQARQPVCLYVTPAGLAWDGEGFPLQLAPPLRVLAFGQGEDFLAFARLAHAYGADVEGFTPSAMQAEMLTALGVPAQVLTHAGRAPEVTPDPWTAVVFLFHDRDWEDALLAEMLRQPALFCGAIGSRKTHADRLARLRAMGCDDAQLAALKGHIGLIPATRDPSTLAVSILAQIVQEYAR